MSDQIRANATHYDSITDAWPFIFGENFHWGLFGDPRDELATATVNLIDTMAGMCEGLSGARVLDVGCGIGGPAIHLATFYGCSVTGISVSAVGIRRARERAAGSDVGGRLDFRVCDAMQMDLSGPSFDVAWVMESSHLMPDKKRLITECCRLLKPGGRLVLCDLMFTRYPRAVELVNMRDELRILERCFGHARLDTPDRYSRLFEEAGLKVTAQRDISEQVTPTLLHWRKNIDNNWKLLAKYFTDSQKKDFLESCRILERLFHSSSWGYGIISGVKLREVGGQS